jgi:hypothetical protein
MIEITVSEIAGILGHVARWLANLKRAKKERKQQSRRAIQKVVLAVRETAAYVSHLRNGGEKTLEKETHLAMLWTELSFRLQDLELKELAIRCDIKGRYWANPNEFNEEFLKSAKVRLEDIEREAHSLLCSLS